MNEIRTEVRTARPPRFRASGWLALGALALALGSVDTEQLEHALPAQARAWLGTRVARADKATTSGAHGALPMDEQKKRLDKLGLAPASGPALLLPYLLFPSLAALAAAAMTAIGLFISVTSRSAVQAQGTAVFAWFAFALLYDLVVIGWLATGGMPAEWLAATLVANPIDATRVLGVLALEPDLYTLGPAGAFLSARLAPAGAAALLSSAVLIWAIAPVAAAVVQFSRPLKASVRRNRSHDTKSVSDLGGDDRPGRRDRVRARRRAASI